MDQERVTSSTPVELRRWTTTAASLARERCEVAVRCPEMQARALRNITGHAGVKINTVLCANGIH